MKFSCRLDKFYGYVVNTIMVLVTGVLLLLALFSTSVITAGEYTTYASDNVFLQIIAVAVVMVIAVCAVKSEKIKKMLENPMLPRIAFIALASFLLVLIVGTQLSPGADSGMICAVARRIISNDLSEDFTLTTIQYMQKYPNQNGMVVFIYLLFNLVGVDNYVALQIINLISLGVAYYFIYVLLKELFGIRIANVSLLIMCAFLPFSIYVMFVYGTMLGMAFAMMACTFLMKFFKNGKMRYGFIAAVSAALATAFKSNYMIVFVALVITALPVFLRSKDFKVLAVIFVGGFLFHFIWEAKCQYTVVYVLLLIPYAVMGYNAVCKIIAEQKNKSR